MNVDVLARIWGQDTGYVFTPTIQGWETDPKTGRKKAKRYTEGNAYTPQNTVDLARKVTDIHILNSRTDCYFCPVKFKQTSRRLEFTFDKINLLWADLDDADPHKIPLRPTIAWKSSEHHYQAIWILDKELPAAEIATLNRAMTYQCGADKSGWDLTQLLRVPGSYNFKYGDPEPCTLLWDDGPVYPVDQLRQELSNVNEDDNGQVVGTELVSLLQNWRLPKRATDLIFTQAVPEGEDRSARLWELEKLLIENGLPVATIVEVIRQTVWNKFSERRDGDRQLLAETLKAEAQYRTGTQIAEPIAEPVTLGLLTFDGLMSKELTEPQFLVQGFVQEASVGICAGEPKTMKSTMMLDLSLCVATGDTFLGAYRTRKSPVLYIQEENAEADIKRRFMRIAINRSITLSTNLGVEPENAHLFVVNNPGLDLRTAETQNLLEQHIQNNGIKLLVLDPWYMMCPGIDENNAKDVTPILKFLTGLRNKYACAVILVHHFKKGEASRGGQRVRGSSVFHSWTESGLYVELNKGKNGNVMVEREFRAFAPDKDLNVVYSDSKKHYDVCVQTDEDGYVSKPEVTQPQEVGETDL